jgi:putative oxidoreductase
LKDHFVKPIALLTLRVSIALLVLLWGLDKLLDPEHALRVSDSFYMGLLSWPGLMPVLGIAQVAVAGLAMVGLFRPAVDPLVLLINLGSLAGVWRSIVDPWGWFLEGTNVLFFPSLIVAAGCLVLIAFQDQESLVLDRVRRRNTGA